MKPIVAVGLRPSTYGEPARSATPARHGNIRPVAMTTSKAKIEASKRSKALAWLSRGPTYGVFLDTGNSPHEWGLEFLACDREHAFLSLGEHASEWTADRVASLKLCLCRLVWDEGRDQYMWRKLSRISPATTRRMIRQFLLHQQCHNN